MILKKKKKNIALFKVLLKLYRYFNKLIIFLGYSFFSIIIFVIIFFYTSNIYKFYTPKELTLKINDKILAKYIGLDFRLYKDYLKIFSLNLTKKLRNNNLENVFIEINQQSILGLELQRNIKQQTGGPIPDEMKIWYPAKIKYKNKNFDIKIKLKGNRFIHWHHPKKTSYKIDLRGNKYFLEMEEFSLQKPVTKNYTYEFLFHKLLKHIGLTNINYEFVNLFFNDQNYGVFAVEESFSNQLLIRQKKPIGPIFSIKDELGEKFPNIFFELYSEKFWLEKNPKLVNDLFIILNNLKQKKIDINLHFDIDKWAKYFSIMDLAGTYHGALFDSVKLYYNIDTGLFEPIGYDLHKGAGEFDNFIISDFLDNRERPNCIWICDHEELFNIFLKKNKKELNYEFIEKYSFYLNEYSKKEFLDDFLNKNKIELKKYNNAIYQDNSKTDKIGWTGAGYFIFDKDYLYKRSRLIRSRIDSVKLDQVMISKFEDYIFFENFLTFSFPIKATITDCKNILRNNSKYFLVGRMKIKFTGDCKSITLKDFNNNSTQIELINRPEINF